MAVMWVLHPLPASAYSDSRGGNEFHAKGYAHEDEESIIAARVRNCLYVHLQRHVTALGFEKRWLDLKKTTKKRGLHDR